MSKKRAKQYLMLLCVIGLVSVASGSGTFASFTAETTNAGNTFATGTIVLSNTVNAGTACLSTNGGSTDTNVYAGCDKVFQVSVKKPGDSFTTDQIDIQNAGSLNASSFTLTGSSCSTSDAAGQTYHGTGDLCPVLDVYVQEWTSSSYSTPAECWYGGNVGVGNTCSFDDSQTVSGLTTPLALGSLSANGDRYFTIGIELQSSADNTVQGRSATSDLTWDIAQ
jgi:predicted ribosomally synthesized peptide with SipW-like signal peptide